METLDITHEVVGTSQPVTIEQTVKQEIQKFNLADAAIADLKAKYGGLKIPDATDNKAYELVKSARQEVRTKRTGIEKMRKHLKSDYIAIGKAIDGEAERLTALLLEVESPLDAEIKRVDDEKERVKKEAEEAAQLKLNGRINELRENGMQYNGAFYEIAGISLDVVTLKNISYEQYAAVLEKVKNEHRTILEAIEADNRRKEEERLAFEKERQEQVAERLRLERREKEIADKQEADRVRMEHERRDLERERAQLQMEREEKEAAERKEKQDAISRKATARMDYLTVNFGMMPSSMANEFYRPSKFDGVPTLTASFDFIWTATDAEWMTRLNTFIESLTVILLKEESLELKAKDEAETQRATRWVSDVEKSKEFLAIIAEAMSKKPAVTDVKVLAALNAFDEQMEAAVNSFSESISNL